MGKQPSIIIIARHGARIDQGNQEWHVAAERPWDPPLSYGGWAQSQSLGARISGELDTFSPPEQDGEGQNGRAHPPPPRKRRKITIHSSPYLRCVQTAIGIAAGLKYPKEAGRPRAVPVRGQRSALSKPLKPDEDVAADMGGERQSKIASAGTSTPVVPSVMIPQGSVEEELADLKLDPFLGEWLSAGYFEKTTPPPSSEVLVENAKEMLKRPPEEIKGADLTRVSLHEMPDLTLDEDGSFKDSELKLPPMPVTGLRAMATVGHALQPKRSRTLSFGKESPYGALHDSRHHRRARSSTVYSPPVPTYAIAPQDAIPPGFVAHARDNCVSPDLTWNSQLPPLCWGDGGQYEEDWSVMHRRFRNGLQQMLLFYGAKSVDASANAGDGGDEDDPEDDEDHVLILVTHQAGCNALIRLVTSAPALHDVGTASLTLAVRKKDNLARRASGPSSRSPTRRRRGSLDLGLGDEFDMKIIASTEHLRGGSNPLGLNSPRLGRSPAFASRRAVGPESIEGFSIGDPLAHRSNSMHGVGRSSSLRSHTAESSPAITPLSGSGLWGASSSRSGSVGTDTGVDPRSRSDTIPEADESWLPDGTDGTDGESTTADIDSTTWQPASRVALPTRQASVRVVNGSNGLWGGVRDNTPQGGLWGGRSSFGQHTETTNDRQRRWTADNR